jgi:hypothetical protein
MPKYPSVEVKNCTSSPHPLWLLSQLLPLVSVLAFLSFVINKLGEEKTYFWIQLLKNSFYQIFK